MNTKHHSQKSAEKTDQSDELKTEGPLSEKDEVKAAERKTGQLHKKAAEHKKKK